MNYETTPIVFATDENFVLQAAVAIVSLLENGLNNNQVEIYVLTTGKMSRDAIGLFDVIRENYSYAVINIVEIDEREFDNISIKKKRLSRVTLYRLLLPQILKQYKTCLYLDSDVLIRGDITDLQNIDLKKNYIAGVPDEKIRKNEKYGDIIGIPNTNSYVNAGVLLMNLDQLRKDKKYFDFIQEAQCGYGFLDQDVLNKCCYGNILFLSSEYNVFAREEQLHKIIKIIHFTGGQDDRPWQNERGVNVEEWWSYAKIFKDNIFYIKLKEQMRALTNDKLFSHIVAACRHYETVFIWGYSDYGRNLLDALLRNDILNVKGFIDSNSDKKGESYQDKTVYLPMEIKYLDSVLIINAVQIRRKDVNDTLKQLGVKQGNIQQYYCKDKMYYQVLDRNYYQDEFEEFLLWEYGIKK